MDLNRKMKNDPPFTDATVRILAGVYMQCFPKRSCMGTVRMNKAKIQKKKVRIEE